MYRWRKVRSHIFLKTKHSTRNWTTNNLTANTIMNSRTETKHETMNHDQTRLCKHVCSFVCSACLILSSFRIVVLASSFGIRFVCVYILYLYVLWMVNVWFYCRQLLMRFPQRTYGHPHIHPTKGKGSTILRRQSNIQIPCGIWAWVIRDSLFDRYIKYMWDKTSIQLLFRSP